MSDTDKQSSASFGLADEDNLFKLRIPVRDVGHNVVAWEEYATLHDALLYGWSWLFGPSRPGMQALRLLANLLSFSPMHRMSASEALVGPYLNSHCDAEPPPELPPAMPYSILSHVQRWKRDKEVNERECSLEDLFTRVIAVELTWPLGLSLEPHTGKPGARVTGVIEGTEAAKLGLQEGDTLLAIGSIDCRYCYGKHGCLVYSIFNVISVCLSPLPIQWKRPQCLTTSSQLTCYGIVFALHHWSLWPSRGRTL